MRVDNKPVQLQLCDTAGQVKYLQAHYKNTLFLLLSLLLLLKIQPEHTRNHNSLMLEFDRKRLCGYLFGVARRGGEEKSSFFESVQEHKSRFNICVYRGRRRVYFLYPTLWVGGLKVFNPSRVYVFK